MIGILFAVLASVCWASSAVLVRLGVQTLRPTTGTWVSLIPGTILIMALALVFNLSDFATLTAAAFFWFALGGLFNFALGRFLNATSIQRVGVARAAPLFSAAPLFATSMAIIFLGETTSVGLVAGTVSIVAGVVVITSEGVNR